MKFVHLSDLHLGKRVNGFNMLKDQQYILSQILAFIGQEKPDCVLIAGDIYDKAVPPTEAVSELDAFLFRLVEQGIRVLMVTGNHDCPERVSCNGRLMERSGVFISPRYNGKVTPVTLYDAYGPVNFYLLPFIKPIHVREAFPDRSPDSYNTALRIAVKEMGVDRSARNVLITHQFVTGAVRCDSEEFSVGGSDNVDAAVFEDFDYVALGHIHGPQCVGRDTVRYCGTPLKYSFSETGHKKSMTVVALGPKGEVKITTVPLKPLRDMVELKGSYYTLSLRENARAHKEDYVHLTLTDEEDIPDAAGKLRIFYPYLMKLDYDNKRTRAGGLFDAAPQTANKSPMELLDDFYKSQNGQAMVEAARALSQEIMEEIWGGGE